MASYVRASFFSLAGSMNDRMKNWRTLPLSALMRSLERVSQSAVALEVTSSAEDHQRHTSRFQQDGGPPFWRQGPAPKYDRQTGSITVIINNPMEPVWRSYPQLPQNKWFPQQIRSPFDRQARKPASDALNPWYFSILIRSPYDRHYKFVYFLQQAT